MSAVTLAGVEFDAVLADLRHMSARAASDLADWLVHMQLENKADRTLYGYHRAVAPLLRAHPDKPIGDFTAADVNDQLRLVPPRSRHISRSIYNRFFEWALFDDRIERSPMQKVPRIQHPRRRPKDIFSEAEVALLEALPAPDGQLWTILFGTGLRRSEARHLQRKHIDLGRELLVVYRGKGDKDRIVGLPMRVRVAVADLDLLERLAPDDYLWYTRRGARRLRRDPIGDTTFSRGPQDSRPGWYERGINAAGVRYLNPHQTRHTYGHWLRDAGLDLEERQESMGHESIDTTVRYYGRVTPLDVARKTALL